MTLGVGPALDCRNFVEAQYQEQVLRQRRERGAAVPSVLFCAGPAPQASGPAPFLACASSRGHIALHRQDEEQSGAGACLSPARQDGPETEEAEGRHEGEGAWEMEFRDEAREGGARQMRTANAGGAVSQAGAIPPALILEAHTGPALGLLDTSRAAGGESALGHLLLSCGEDGRICGWRLDTLQDVLQSAEPLAPRTCLNIQVPPWASPLATSSGSTASGLLASSCDSGPFRVPQISAMASLDPGFVYAACGSGELQLWDLGAEQLVRGVPLAGAPLTSLARCQDGQLAAGTGDGSVHLWDSRSDKCTAVLDPWRATASECGAPRAPLSASASGIAGGQAGGASPRVPISALAGSANGNWLIAGTGLGTVTVYSLRTLQSCAPVSRFVAAKGPIRGLAAGESSVLVASGEDRLHEWGLDGRALSQMRGSGPLVSVDRDPSTKMVAAGVTKGCVDLYTELGVVCRTLCA